jgi:hypothetical protein
MSSLIATLLKRPLERTANLFLKSIPVDDIRCGANAVQVEEGWGGEKIAHFLPIIFLSFFTKGRKKRP